MDPHYLQAIGQVVWNFSLLEWDVIYLIVKLNNDDWTKARLEETSGTIANALDRSIADVEPFLSHEFINRLRVLTQNFRNDILERNGLLHVHPYTSATGSQQLGGTDRHAVRHEWTLERLDQIASQFAAHRRVANSLLHEYVRQHPKSGP